MTTHETVQGLLGVRVLGALSDVETALVDHHLDACRTCREEVLALCDATERLLQPGDAPVALWRRIAAAVAASDGHGCRGAGVGSQDEHLSNGFQRALVPRRIPSVDGWAIATAYEAAGEQLLLGGEFYEVAPLAGGGVALLVGDVSGGGPAAAIAALSVRAGVKAVLRPDGDAARAMTTIDKTLTAEIGGALVRLTIVVVEPGGDTVTLLSAGGPPPWLSTARGVGTVAVPDSPPLGIGSWADCNPTELHLGDGDTLVVVSPSVTEAWSARDLPADHAVAELLGSAPKGLPVHDLAVRVIDLAVGAAGPGKVDLVAAAVRRRSRR